MKKIYQKYLFLIVVISSLSTYGSTELIKSISSKIFPDEQLNTTLQKTTEILSFFDLEESLVDSKVLYTQIKSKQDFIENKLNKHFTKNELESLNMIVSSKVFKKNYHSLISGEIFEHLTMKIFEGFQFWLENQGFPTLDIPENTPQQIDLLVKTLNENFLYQTINFHSLIESVVDDKSLIPDKELTNREFKKYCNDSLKEILMNKIEKDDLQELLLLFSNPSITKLFNICLLVK